MKRPPLPTISVIIPALNEVEAISRCLRSVSDVHVHEKIVVDGGSADGTRTIATEAGATVIVASPGRARQMNAGAAVASGDVLLFLHADCTLEPGATRRLRLVLAGSRFRFGYFRQRIEGDNPVYRLIEFGSCARARWLKRPYGDQALFLTRETFRAIGGFPDVPLMEDLLLARRVRQYAPWLAMPETVTSSARRWQHDGVFHRIWRNWSVALAELRGIALGQLYHQYERGAQHRFSRRSTLDPQRPDPHSGLRFSPSTRQEPAESSVDAAPSSVASSSNPSAASRFTCD